MFNDNDKYSEFFHYKQAIRELFLQSNGDT